MPADRRATFPAGKPVKTERTHEENQERAYIAASRRSDRSLEARIESARRASEIHKKRTGRALRVTEQDVVNEEMYEEEDDDLPSQYQRLNAHLQTSSWLFQRKLHDYIATQQGVRNMFLQQQFPDQNFQPHAAQFQPSPGQLPFMNQAMLPPQTFNPSTPTFTQPQQSFSPHGFQQTPQGYRQAPYNIPQRPQSHQRSGSISTPHPMATFAPTGPQPVSADATTPREDSNGRRMSLQPHAIESPHQLSPTQSRPSLSRSSTAHSIQQSPISPHGLHTTSSASSSGHGTPQARSGDATPTGHSLLSMPFATSSQVIDMYPLSMSLPPESQQLVGSVLDPNDPRTAIFMAGSDNLPQPAMGRYTYNPNLSSKSSRAGNTVPTLATLTTNTSAPGMTQTLAPESLKLETGVDSASSTSPSALTEDIYTPHSLFTPTNFEYTNFFDQYQSTDSNRTSNEQIFNEPFEDDSFVNWNQ